MRPRKDVISRKNKDLGRKETCTSVGSETNYNSQILGYTLQNCGYAPNKTSFANFFQYKMRSCAIISFDVFQPKIKSLPKLNKICGVAVMPDESKDKVHAQISK